MHGKKGISKGIQLGPKQKRKRSVITLGCKLEMINKHKKGVTTTKIAREYGFPVSTISTILKDKERIIRCGNDPEYLKETTICKVR